jgi:transcriptional antiterminator NusG
MALKWYVVHVYSGFEYKVADFIREQADKKGLTEKIAEILGPGETVTNVRNGTTYEVERKFFPGYVLVRMELDDETWYVVNETPKVTGFLGGKKPVPMTEAEAARIIVQNTEGVSAVKSGVVYAVGEQVRVTDGPFASFVGSVEEVDADKERLKVLVSIFGRATPVDLNYAQVKKV